MYFLPPLGYTFQTVGLEYTTVTNAGFITSTYVVLAPIISWLLYKDVFDRRDVSGVLLAFIGFYFLSGYSGFNVGDIFVFFCAPLFWSRDSHDFPLLTHHQPNNARILAGFCHIYPLRPACSFHHHKI